MSGRVDYLGELEHVVLLALMRLGDGAYGVTVRQEIERRAGRDVSIGATYTTLDRMEAKRLVTSYVGEPTVARGGRAKRHFRITPRGIAAVNRTQEALRNMSRGLSAIGRFV
jgi:DNA-binding PadR family transcriptional regulator